MLACAEFWKNQSVEAFITISLEYKKFSNTIHNTTQQYG